MLEFEWLQQFGGDSGFGRKLDLDGFQSGPRPQFLLEARAIAVIAALLQLPAIPPIRVPPAPPPPIRASLRLPFPLLVCELLLACRL